MPGSDEVGEPRKWIAPTIVSDICGSSSRTCLRWPTRNRDHRRNDQAALSGLSEVNIAFDVTNGDGKALLTQLDVIDETRQSLIQEGAVDMDSNASFGREVEAM